MDRRFFCGTIQGDEAELEGVEAHHLLHVLRAREGDEVVLFDGSGREFQARIQRVRKQAVTFQILGGQVVDRELPLAVHAGVALPKGERQRWLVEKAVELGVTSLTPLETRRGVAVPADSALERLRRYVIEASKQSGRNRLLEIRRPLGVADFCRRAPATAARWFADPSGSCLVVEELGQLRHLHECWLAVGPEGGWTAEESAAAVQQDWRLLGLGPRILRVDTALCAVAALVAVPFGAP